jgi:iron-sulfur cluster assembly protein
MDRDKFHGGSIPGMIEQGTITLTDQARTQLKSLLAKEDNPNLALRLFVTGGGCSGLQYGMAFDDSLRPADEVIDMDGVRVVVDEYTLPHVQGSEIDYVDSLMGAGFTVHNPNAVHSCSCGHSFDTGEDAGTAKACGCGH